MKTKNIFGNYDLIYTFNEILMIFDGFSKVILPALVIEIIETYTGIKNETNRISVLNYV